MKSWIVGVITVIAFLGMACSAIFAEEPAPAGKSTVTPPKAFPKVGAKVNLDDDAWRKRLSDKQYRILRKQGTEYAGTGKFAKHKSKGVYVCAGCNAPLFKSKHKFESGTGWPSFYTVFEEGRVASERDASHGMVRTEVHCASCGGHLGHVFPDGPRPTGLRYCINSASLEFVAEDDLPPNSM